MAIANSIGSRCSAEVNTGMYSYIIIVSSEVFTYQTGIEFEFIFKSHGGAHF
jgi:hypothetical protein